MDLANILNVIFPSDGIYEVILGTSGVQKNLSPIGIIKAKNRLYMKVYKETLTYQNLLSYPYCSLNITKDPIVFFNLLYSNFDSLRISEKLGLPIIDNLPVILGKCNISSSQFYNPVIFDIIPMDYISSNDSLMQAYNRGSAIFIDLLVNLSRYYIYSEKNEIKDFCTVLKYELDVIRRTSKQLYSIIEKGKPSLIADINKLCGSEV